VKNEYGCSLASIYNNLNDIEKYKKEIDYLNTLISEKSRILDIGCGTGIHNYILSSLGHDCVGIDISKQMIEVANANNKTDARFINVSVEEFTDNKRFDLCISLFNVINHVIEVEKLKTFFERVAQNLNKGGLFVFDCFNSIAVIKSRPLVKGKSGFTITPEYNPYSGILKMEYAGTINFTLTHRIWDISLLVEMLGSAGFEVEFYKRNTFQELAEDDYKITFICRRIK